MEVLRFPLLRLMVRTRSACNRPFYICDDLAGDFANEGRIYADGAALGVAGSTNILS